MTALIWHIGIVVRDVEEAKDELGRALQIEWTETFDITAGEWTYRAALSRQGPPHLELIQGSPGSPWDPSTGPRIDHLAFWADNLAETRRRLDAEGVPLALDGSAVGQPLMNYHVAPRSGLRLESVSTSFQQTLRTVVENPEPRPSRHRR